MTVTPTDLAEIASRLKFRQIVGIIAAIVLIGWMITFGFLSSDLINSSTHTGQLAARSDCKTQYTSILDGPVKARDDLNSQVASITADLQSQLGTALLDLEAGQSLAPSVITQYAATKAVLDARRTELGAAIAVVMKEPSLNEATVKGFRFDGTVYPACPLVDGS